MYLPPAGKLSCPFNWLLLLLLLLFDDEFVFVVGVLLVLLLLMKSLKSVDDVVVFVFTFSYKFCPSFDDDFSQSVDERKK